MVAMRTFVDEGLGHSSYLVDLGDGAAAILDPPRFPSPHLSAAKASGTAVRWTIDTHSHADYVTGSPAVAVDGEVTFIAPAASKLETPHRALHDEERITLARGVTLTAIATPGHTPDHHVYLLEHDGTLTALFSGGSLMVGTVGRTDLCGPELAEPLAHDMFHSLRRLDGLPDDLAVYPTHGAGSFCSAPGGADRTTTLGRERATNHLFRIDDEDAFVEQLMAGFGSFPTYFVRLPELNRRGPRRYAQLPRLDRLDVDTVERHVDEGALIVDARPITDFAAGYVPGSMSNALRPVFASWLGWLADLERPIVIFAGDGQDRDELVRQCLDIGHENIVGELDGGIDAWRAAGRSITGIPLVGPDAIVGTVVDVRQRSEFEAGHVPGAIGIELGSLTSSPVPDGPVTVMCGHGERAMTGASILTARGHRDVSVIDGGPDTWAAWSGQPLAVGR
jgi:glyoxylase-like metal-dependent hydrolase (beta-lactamase superfamily II)/rhodanese-related sulfurtransferase